MNPRWTSRKWPEAYSVCSLYDDRVCKIQLGWSVSVTALVFAGRVSFYASSKPGPPIRLQSHEDAVQRARRPPVRVRYPRGRGSFNRR
jgi:hypothetical protein